MTPAKKTTEATAPKSTGQTVVTFNGRGKLSEGGELIESGGTFKTSKARLEELLAAGIDVTMGAPAVDEAPTEANGEGQAPTEST